MQTKLKNLAVGDSFYWCNIPYRVEKQNPEHNDTTCWNAAWQKFETLHGDSVVEADKKDRIHTHDVIFYDVVHGEEVARLPVYYFTTGPALPFLLGRSTEVRHSCLNKYSGLFRRLSDIRRMLKRDGTCFSIRKVITKGLTKTIKVTL